MKLQTLLTALCVLFFTATMSVSVQAPISKKQWKKTTRAIYHYDCGSLPYQHKRDYSISIDKDSIIVKVYAYKGKKKVAYASSPAKFESVKSKLAAMNLGKKKYTGWDSRRPNGAYTESVSCFMGGKLYFSANKTKDFGTLYVKNGSPRAVFLDALPKPINTIIDGTI